MVQGDKIGHLDVFTLDIISQAIYILIKQLCPCNRRSLLKLNNIKNVAYYCLKWQHISNMMMPHAPSLYNLHSLYVNKKCPGNVKKASKHNNSINESKTQLLTKTILTGQKRKEKKHGKYQLHYYKWKRKSGFSI